MRFRFVLFSMLGVLFSYNANAVPVLDVREFCQDLDLSPAARQVIAKLPPLDSSAVQRVNGSGPNWSWVIFQTPNELLKRESVWTNLAKTGYPTKSQSDIRNIQDRLRKVEYVAPNDSQVADVNLFKSMVKAGRSGGFSGMPYTVNKRAYLTCLTTYGYGKESACSHAVNEMLVNNGPSSNYGLFLEDVVAEVILDPVYRAPVNRYAAKLIDHLFDPSLPVTNALEDLVAEFKKTGLSEQQAIDKAMNVMAYISIQGPELYMILSYGWLSKIPENVKYFQENILLALHFISTIPGVIDLRLNNAGKATYFLPPPVQANCLNGKFYHFWLSAWWSWHFSKQFLSDKDQVGATRGSWLVTKSYQKFSRTYGRGFLRALKEPLYASYANHQRRDLSFYASGLRFGRQLANLKSLDWSKYQQSSVDESLRVLMSSAREIDRTDIEEDIAKVDKAFQSGNVLAVIGALPTFDRLSKMWDEMFQVDKIFD